MNINFDPKNYLPLPAATYTALIEHMEPKLSNAGNPMLKVRFNVQEEPYTGRKVWGYFVIMPDNMKSIVDMFIACGYSQSDFVGNVDVNALAAEVSRQKPMVDIDVTIWGDVNDQNGVDRVRPQFKVVAPINPNPQRPEVMRTPSDTTLLSAEKLAQQRNEDIANSVSLERQPAKNLLG